MPSRPKAAGGWRRNVDRRSIVKVQAAILTALIGLAATPASAQPRWADEPAPMQGLPTRMLMRIVRYRGLDPVSRPIRRDGFYYVQAMERSGRPRRVVIDARNGRVVSVQSGAAP